MKRILILNGPNINLTGIREPEIYGTKTYAELMEDIRDFGKSRGCSLTFLQSNSEGALIDAIQMAWKENMDGIVFNPGGYAHTSVALRDAISSVPLPTVEVHMTNIDNRESFRRTSLTAGACLGTIAGFGFRSYLLAIEALLGQSSQTNAGL